MDFPVIRASSLAVPYQTSFTNGTHDAMADVHIEKGGAGQGFGPHELFEAAFATCMIMTVRMSAAECGIPLTEARCEVQVDRSVPNAVTLNYTLRFDGPLTGDHAARLREAASRCPVARTLTGAISLKELPAVVDSEGI